MEAGSLGRERDGGEARWMGVGRQLDGHYPIGGLRAPATPGSLAQVSSSCYFADPRLHVPASVLWRWRTIVSGRGCRVYGWRSVGLVLSSSGFGVLESDNETFIFCFSGL